MCYSAVCKHLDSLPVLSCPEMEPANEPGAGGSAALKPLNQVLQDADQQHLFAGPILL